MQNIKLPKPKAILFDLDGTLADSAQDLIGAVNKMRLDRNLSKISYYELKKEASQGVKGILHKALNIKPSHIDYLKYQEEFLNIYQSQICNNTILFEGVVETINFIIQQDIIWGIVTNKAKKYTFPLIEELHNKFNLPKPQVIACGDTTAYPKPYPDSLLYACAQIDVEPNMQDVWFIGDDIKDIQAARSANIFSIAASYGYLGIEDNFLQWNANLIINHIIEIKDLIS